VRRRPRLARRDRLQLLKHDQNCSLRVCRIQLRHSHIILDKIKNVAYVTTGIVLKYGNLTGDLVIIGNVSTALADLPAAFAMADDHLFIYHDLVPAKMTSVANGSFTWNATIDLPSSMNNGYVDNVVSDDNFIYALSQDAVLCRMTYRNDRFAVFDFIKIPTTRDAKL
jgi:hypothetical protein